MLTAELDIVGKLFGIRFNGELAELYIEDDGHWHLKATFDKSWLKDLSIVASLGTAPMHGKTTY